MIKSKGALIPSSDSTTTHVPEWNEKCNANGTNANAMPQNPSQNACGAKINGIRGMLLIFPCLWFLSELYPSLNQTITGSKSYLSPKYMSSWLWTTQTCNIINNHQKTMEKNAENSQVDLEWDCPPYFRHILSFRIQIGAWFEALERWRVIISFELDKLGLGALQQ